MKAKVNIAATATEIKKLLFPTGENRIGGNSFASDFYATAITLVEEVAKLDSDVVGVKIARQIAKPNAEWHAALSNKQAWAITYAIASAVEKGEIIAVNYLPVIVTVEEEKPAKKAEKPAKKATNWKNAKAEKAEKEKKELEAVNAICAVGGEVEHSMLGHGRVVANDGINVAIEFDCGVKKFVLAFLAGRISAVAQNVRLC